MLCVKKRGEPHYEGRETGHWRSGLFIPEQIIPSKCKKKRGWGTEKTGKRGS
jgi:hypothetical protein